MVGAEWIALAGTIIATIGVQVVARWLSRQDRKSNDAAQIRSELKQQVTDYKTENLRLEDEVDEWRNKYYAAIEELVAKKIELQGALDQIKRNANDSVAVADEAKKIL